MIHVEKLLGGFLSAALSSGMGVGRATRGSRSSFFGAGKGAVGMGIFGVAMAAFEHFSQGGSLTGSPGGGAPPPPPGGSGTLPRNPAPGASSRPPPPPPPPLPVSPGGRGPPAPPAFAGPPGQTSLLLLRAMIAAASADGVIDESERRRVHERIAAGGVTPEERAFLDREIDTPGDLEQIVSGAKASGVGAEVYLVSLLAIHVDEPAEVEYLKRLADRLGLDASTIAKCHEQAGVPLLP